MKICTKCYINKELDDFHNMKVNKDGKSHWCKTCKKEYDKIYRQSDKIQSLYKSKYYRDTKKEYQRYRFETDFRRQLLIQAKARAKKNNLSFDIEIEDIIVPEICPILEIKLERKPYGERGSFRPNSPSLDKIIPELGYIKGNIIVISMKANIMKCNATQEELLLFAKNINKLIK